MKIFNLLETSNEGRVHLFTTYQYQQESHLKMSCEECIPIGLPDQI